VFRLSILIQQNLYCDSQSPQLPEALSTEIASLLLAYRIENKESLEVVRKATQRLLGAAAVWEASHTRGMTVS
jgi:hypothetical protein